MIYQIYAHLCLLLLLNLMHFLLIASMLMGSCTRYKLTLSIIQVYLYIIYVGIRLAKYDQITINYTLGTFTTCTNSIIISRSSSSTITPTTCSQVTTNTPNTLIYRATSANTQNYTMTINFITCNFNMPPSTLPIYFTYLFSATDSNGVTGNSYLIYRCI